MKQSDFDRTICIDFDDTINAYPGWVGEGYRVIHGRPVPGAREAIIKLRARGYRIVVNSARCGFWGGCRAIRRYLKAHDIKVDAVSRHKPPARIYVDDRGYRFSGDWMNELWMIEQLVEVDK